MGYLINENHEGKPEGGLARREENKEERIGFSTFRLLFFPPCVALATPKLS